MKVVAFRHVELYDYTANPARLIFKGLIREVTEYWGCPHCSNCFSKTYMTHVYK